MSETYKSDFACKTEAGIKIAIAEALEEHRRMGRSIVIWRDGKVVNVPPSEIQTMRDESKDHTA